MHHHHWPSKDVQYAQITVIRSTNSSGIGICVYGMCVYISILDLGEHKIDGS